MHIRLTLRTFVRVAVLVALLVIPLLLTTPAYADIDASKSAACEGIGLANGATGCQGGGANRVYGVVKAVVNLLSVIVGIAAVIMVIVSGFKYVTSAGDSNRIASAKNTLIYAIVGLIIVALAQFIVRFVLGELS